MPRSFQASASSEARDDATWDRDCTLASGILLIAGGVTATLRGQAYLGEVCTALGMVFLSVAAGLWAFPRRHRRAASTLPPGPGPGSDPQPSPPAEPASRPPGRRGRS